MSEKNIKTIVKENYGKIAAGTKSFCCESSVSSCGKNRMTDYLLCV